MLQTSASNTRQMMVVRRALRDIIATELTPRQREVVLLYWFEEKRICDIARELGVAGTTVSRTLRRGMANIRHHMRFYIEYDRMCLTDDDDE